MDQKKYLKGAEPLQRGNLFFTTKVSEIPESFLER